MDITTFKSMIGLRVTWNILIRKYLCYGKVLLTTSIKPNMK